MKQNEPFNEYFDEVEQEDDLLLDGTFGVVVWLAVTVIAVMHVILCIKIV